jgi:hypothetical protein
MKAKDWLAAIIYWVFSVGAVLLILNAGYDQSFHRMFDIGQVSAGAVIYFIGRDMRRVLMGDAQRTQKAA